LLSQQRDDDDDEREIDRDREIETDRERDRRRECVLRRVEMVMNRPHWLKKRREQDKEREKETDSIFERDTNTVMMMEFEKDGDLSRRDKEIRTETVNKMSACTFVALSEQQNDQDKKQLLHIIHSQSKDTMKSQNSRKKTIGERVKEIEIQEIRDLLRKKLKECIAIQQEKWSERVLEHGVFRLSSLHPANDRERQRQREDNTRESSYGKLVRLFYDEDDLTPSLSLSLSLSFSIHSADGVASFNNMLGSSSSSRKIHLSRGMMDTLLRLSSPSISNGRDRDREEEEKAEDDDDMIPTLLFFLVMVVILLALSYLIPLLMIH
jgi:hypothetical protein